MQKLLNTYKLDPSEANKAKLIKYARKHMMAICMLQLEDQKLMMNLGV